MSLKNNDIRLQFKNKTVRIDINKIKDIIPILDKKCNDVEGINEFLQIVIKHIKLDKTDNSPTITYKWIYGLPPGIWNVTLRTIRGESLPCKRHTILEVRDKKIYLTINFPDEYGSRWYYCFLLEYNRENEKYIINEFDNNRLKLPKSPEDTSNLMID